MYNEVWEKAAAFLMDLRCTDRKRDSSVRLDSCIVEREKLDKRREQYFKACDRVSANEKEAIEGYVEQLQQTAFEEQQEAYCQGMVDMLQIFGGLQILPVNGNIQKLIEKLQINSET